MSSNKYVPPHMRNKPQVEEDRKPRYQNNRRYEKPRWQVLEEEEETRRKEKQEQGLENTEQNFPALSTTNILKPKIGKSFAQIAAEGHERHELEEQKKTYQERRREQRFDMPLPVFHNIHNYTEPEDDMPQDQPKHGSQTEDGWITVDRKKYYKKKLPEEERPPTPEEQSEQKDDTVWNQPEEHETCWDERY